MLKIQYIGLNKFDHSEIVIVNELVEKHLQKISHDLEDFSITIKLKKHSIANKKIDESVKYSVHAKINSKLLVLNASYADWDLKRTIHKIMQKLHNEIKHKFKTQRKFWVKKRYLNV